MQVYHAFEQEHYTNTPDTSQNSVDEIILSECLSRTPITLCVNAKVLSTPVQWDEPDHYTLEYIDLEIQQYLRNQTHVSFSDPFKQSYFLHANTHIVP